MVEGRVEGRVQGVAMGYGSEFRVAWGLGRG